MAVRWINNSFIFGSNISNSKITFFLSRSALSFGSLTSSFLLENKLLVLALEERDSDESSLTL